MTRLINAILFILFATASLADVYKSVDEKGNVTYSDKPVKDGMPVNLPPVNVVPPPPPQETKSPITETSPGYSVFKITAPANDTTIPRGQKEITVEIAITPLLRPGHFIALDLNDNRIGEPQKDKLFRLEPSPGTQTLVANIVNKSGSVVQTTPPIIIHKVTPGSLTTTILREKAQSEGNTQKADRYAPKAPQAPTAPQAPRGSQHDQSPPKITP